MNKRLAGWIVGAVLGLALSCPVPAADALYYGVIKSHLFEQAPGNPPQPVTSNAYAFNALVLCTTNYAVTNATVKVPDALGTVHTLGSVSNGIALRYERAFDTQAALDAAYPSNSGLFNASSYTMTMQTVHDGTPSPKVTYLLSSLPKTPTIANLAAAQAIDATRDFTLGWEPFNGTAADIVQVLVTDAASNVWYSSPLPFTDGAINGGATSVAIPAGLLPPGRTLIGHLAIARPGLPNTDDYAGAIGIAAQLKDTTFPMATLPALPPTLQVLSVSAASAQLGFIGESNRVYHLYGSVGPGWATGNPAAWQWLVTTNSPTGRGTLTDFLAAAYSRRLYRLEVGP